MDDFRMIKSRSKLKMDRTVLEIKNKIADKCSENGIEFDKNSLTGVWSGQSSTAFFEWKLEIEDGDRVIVQDLRVPPTILIGEIVTLLIPTLLFVFLYVLQNHGLPNAWPESMGFVRYGIFISGMVVSLIFFTIFELYMLYKIINISSIPDPLVDAQDEGYGYRKFTGSRFTNVITVAWFILLTLAAIINNASVTILIGATALTVELLYYSLYYIDGGDTLLRAQTDTVIGDLKFSSVPKQYFISAIVLTIIVLAMVLFISLFNVIFISVLGGSTLTDLVGGSVRSIPYLDEILALLLLVFGLKHVQNISEERMKISYYDFKSNNPSKYNKLLDSTIILATSSILYFVLLFSIEILFGISVMGIPPFTTALNSVLTVGALLSLYFPVGICYQNFREFDLSRQLIKNSKQNTIELNEFESTYRILPTDDYYAAAFSYLGEDYKIISRGLVELLDKRPLAAVIAHEEGHIENNDTRLCNIILVLSTILLTGKNVLYTLVNFQKRECAADDYAAKTVGKEPLIEAFTDLKAQTGSDDESIESFGANFAPNFDHSESTIRIDSFKLYYGEFALGESHSSLEDRIDRLENDQ